MASITEGITGNSPIAVGMSRTTKKPSARKLPSKFFALLYVKQKADVRRLGDAKIKYKAIMTNSDLWYSINKIRGYIKINACVKQALYN